MKTNLLQTGQIRPFGPSAAYSLILAGFMLWAAAAIASGAVVRWVGGPGDGAWNDPANWSGGVPPAATDSVVIDLDNTGIDLRSAAQIKDLTIGRGSRVMVSSADGRLQVTGNFSLDGNLTSLGGATITFASLTLLTNAPTTQMSISVYGSQSRIEFPSLQQVQLAANSQGSLQIGAADGGRILFPALALSRGRVNFSASGQNSLIDCPVLAGVEMGIDSGLVASNLGRLQTPSLTRLLRSQLRLEGDGFVDVSRLSILSESTVVAVRQGTLTFPQITGLTNQSVETTYCWAREKGTLAMPHLTNLANALEGGGFYFRADDGGAIRLPQLGEIKARTVIESVGTNSVVELPALSQFTGERIYESYMTATEDGFLSVGTEVPNTEVGENASIRFNVRGSLKITKLTLVKNAYLNGSGRLLGSVVNRGVIYCRAKADPLAIQGDFAQESAGVLQIRLTPSLSPANNQQLTASGKAALAGRLYVELEDGYLPKIGVAFAILTCGSRTGEFETYGNLNAGNSGLELKPSYTAGAFSLQTAAADHPQITNVQPSGQAQKELKEFIVTFSEPILADSFYPAYARLFKPDQTSGTATSVSKVSNTVFKVVFPSQSKQGTYVLTIYEGITDLAQNNLSMNYEQTIVLIPDTADTYAQWRLTLFGLVDGANNSISGESADADQDGLSNLDEYYRNTNPLKKDTDGDGFNDLEELQAGTDPTDPKSFPEERLGVGLAAHITFQTKADVAYQLQVSYDLKTWSEIGSFVGDGRIHESFVPMYDRHAGYFRIKKVGP